MSVVRIIACVVMGWSECRIVCGVEVEMSVREMLVTHILAHDFCTV